MATEYRNRQISQPIVVANVMNGETIATLQSVYPLTEADFVRLRGGAPTTAALAAVIFSGVVGYAISLGPKFEPILSGGQHQLSGGETKTIFVGTCISVILYALGFFLPNERKSVMKNISNHFNTTKSSTHIIGGGK